MSRHQKITFAYLHTMDCPLSPDSPDSQFTLFSFPFAEGETLREKFSLWVGGSAEETSFFTSVFGHFWMGLMGGYYNQRRPYFKGDVQTEFWQNSV